MGVVMSRVRAENRLKQIRLFIAKNQIKTKADMLRYINQDERQNAKETDQSGMPKIKFEFCADGVLKSLGRIPV